MGNRLRADKVQIAVVAVGIRYADLSYVSPQMVLQAVTNLTWEIYQAACRQFLELWNYRPIRHLEIHISRGREYARVPSIEFNCTLTILEQQINVWLIYYKEENRWALVCR